MLLPPKGYLQRLRAICDKHGILLIFDEVITGFGRLGRRFGAECFGVIPGHHDHGQGPDQRRRADGRRRRAPAAIYDAIVDGARRGIELFHGYTYSGHPLACAPPRSPRWTCTERGSARAAPPRWSRIGRSGAQPARPPDVIDIRNFGLIAGIELAAARRQAGRARAGVFHRCFDTGVLIRITGDIVALSPPLIVEPPHSTG